MSDSAFIPAALDDAGLDPFAFRVYCRVARRAGPAGSCFESIGSMAKHLGIWRPNITRALATLVARGMVKVETRRGLPANVTLLPVSAWSKSDPTGKPTIPENREGTPSENREGTHAENRETPSRKTATEGTPVRGSHEGAPVEGDNGETPAPTHAHEHETLRATDDGHGRTEGNGHDLTAPRTLPEDSKPGFTPNPLIAKRHEVEARQLIAELAEAEGVEQREIEQRVADLHDGRLIRLPNMSDDRLFRTLEQLRELKAGLSQRPRAIPAPLDDAAFDARLAHLREQARAIAAPKAPDRTEQLRAWLDAADPEELEDPAAYVEAVNGGPLAEDERALVERIAQERRTAA